MRATRSNARYRLAAIAAGLMLGASHGQAGADTLNVERFSARTVSMTPADIELRVDVREWSDEAGRAAVVAALAEDADTAAALRELPTLGYVWRSDSGVGYAVKYAHRIDLPGGQRATFVTDRRLGVYDFRQWSVDGDAPGAELDYSVIELALAADGEGDGTISLAAEVQIDDENGLVALEPEAARVLGNVKATR